MTDRSLDAKRTVVVSNFPEDAREDELTIHFQKEKNGGGDVDEVVIDGRVAFVIFDYSEVATSILNRPEQVINETKIEVQSYELWLTNTKDSSLVNKRGDSHARGAIKTICVSGIKDSTTTDAIVLYFRNKRRTGGGDLCEGEEGFKRLSPTVARLTFVSSKDAIRVLKKAEETRLKLDGNVLTVSRVLEPTHDQTILLVNNLNSKTSKETLKDFVESTKNADVFEVVLGKGGKAIVILKNKIDEDVLDVDGSSCEELEGFVVFLEFAPLTKSIKIGNILPETSSDAIKFRFSNSKIGGGKVTNMTLDRNNGVAILCFEKPSVVSDLVKKKHAFKEPLTVIPHYDDFEELKESKTETTDYSEEEAKFVSEDLMINDKNKLRFLNFIHYFKNVMTEFPGVQIHETDGASGKLLLLGTTEKTRDVKLRILQDVLKISEIAVKTSVHQIAFLQRSQCEIVNDELKKEDAMLLLINVGGAVGVKALRAKILTLKKCDDNEKQRLFKIVDTKTSEKCITVDEETATFLSKSRKLQEFNKEQFEKHQVLINAELTEPCNIWIVCEKSEIRNAEDELASLIDKNKVSSCTFRPMNAMTVHFLREHRWDKIKEIEKSYKTKGVTVSKGNDADSIEVKGTKAGGAEMILFLEKLAENVDFKMYSLNKPGMKKLMSMDATDAIIAEVEKNHKCVIQKGVPRPVVAGASIMNLPYHSMSFINDKEVKLASGQRIIIVVEDLAQQTVDVIVETINCNNMNANSCGRVLLEVACNELTNECKKIGSLQPGELASTGSAKLNCKRVYHVRPSGWDSSNGTQIQRQIIKECLDQLDKDKLTSIAFSAIDTSNLNYPRREDVRIFFEEVTSYLTTHPQSAINDVRFVACGKDQATVDAFLGAVQEIKSMILSHSGKTTPVKEVPADREIFFKIYCDDGENINNAWEEFERKMNQNIQETIINDEIITKFTDRDFEKLRKLEDDYYFEIKVDQGKGDIKLKGLVQDIAIVKQKIIEILKDIKFNENEGYWNKIFPKIRLSYVYEDDDVVGPRFLPRRRRKVDGYGRHSR